MISQGKLAKILVAVCCLAGLFWSAQGTAQDAPAPLHSDYYPLKVGNKWTYRAGDEKVIERLDKDLVLEKKEKAEKFHAYRLVMTRNDRELTEFIAVRPDGIYRYAGDEKEFTSPLCIFKLPPVADASWEGNVPGSKVTGTFTAKKEKVTVPLRTFDDAILVSGEFQVGSKKMVVKTWFAAGTGIVKKRVELGNETTELELEKFEEAK